LVASSGKTVAVSLAVPPSIKFNLSLSNETLATGIIFSEIVTKQADVYPPSSVVTVIVAVPGFFAMTFPF
jgi:hypothetical protein